jgi:hypothetical protein
MAPDIQPIVGELARCIDMQQRWAAGCVYLHETGDDEAAYEAMRESDRWRDRAEAIEEFMRRAPWCQGSNN